jgi:hypothetical protein
MTDLQTEHAQSIARFRHGVIAELVQWSKEDKGLYEAIQAKAARDYAIPGSTRTRVAAETIRDGLKAYRRGGFDTHLPKSHTHRGKTRRLPPAVVEALLATEEANPARRVDLVTRVRTALPFGNSFQGHSATPGQRATTISISTHRPLSRSARSRSGSCPCARFASNHSPAEPGLQIRVPLEAANGSLLPSTA